MTRRHWTRLASFYRGEIATVRDLGRFLFWLKPASLVSVNMVLGIVVLSIIEALK